MIEEGDVVRPHAAPEDDVSALSPLALTLDDAAIICSVACTVIDRLAEGEYLDRPYSEPLPRGFIKAGEAALLFPAVFALVLNRHPCLMEDGVLQSALQSAALRHAKGRVN